MRLVRTIDAARQALEPYRLSGRIGLVPTMGALHAGHTALLTSARDECDHVVMSLFVNPKQFTSASDLDEYPRDVDSDARRAEATGVDLLFAPEPGALYPPGFDTWVDVEQLSRGLEGAARPGHLRAVATVCLKLFNIIRPARAYFGQKDAQQAAVVTRMAADLDLEIEIRVVPTVRDEDGLALSSRNARLSPEQRAVALALPRALAAGAAAGRDGGSAVDTARSMLEAAEGLEIDYVEEARLNATRLLLAAVTVGGTRLIDNVPLAHRETERSP